MTEKEHERTVLRMMELRKLQKGWDSYGAAPISEAALQSAFRVLATLGQLTPCNDGGVQIDWPDGAELTFKPDGAQEFDDVAVAAFNELAERHKAVLGREIHTERIRQDCQWGGPEHDDQHDRFAWPRFIRKQIARADEWAFEAHGACEQMTIDNAILKYEAKLINIAALAIAAIQSSRRKRGQC